ncbi:MAG TPA: YciI family protein [Iamia sp.]|nr:YciI family protein [Iamia sp.]
MRAVALFRPGPEWVPGKTIYEQGPCVQGHLEAMRRLFDEGTLLLGGPFDRAGGIAVLEVLDEEEAVDLMAADPGVVADVFSVEVRSLLAYFDAFAGARADGTVDDLAAAPGRRAPVR